MHVALDEWSPWHPLPLELSGQALRLCTRLDVERKLRVRRTLGGTVEIRSTQWVGAVDLDGVEVSIAPKFNELNGGLTTLLQRAFGLAGVSWIEAERSINPEVRAPIPDIVVMMLTAAGERLLREGLLTDYVDRRDLLPAVRGRINAYRQVTERPGRLDQVWCDFQERSAAIPENRLIAAALAVGLRIARLPMVRERARRVLGEFDAEMDRAPFGSIESLRRVTRPDALRSDRLRARYAPIAELAWLVIDHAGIGDLPALGAHRSQAFLVDMNQLFERFVAGWLDDQLGPLGVRVNAQHSAAAFVDLKTKRHVNRMRPDLVLDGPAGSRIVADTKYKRMDPSSGRLVASAADLQQATLYAAWMASPRPASALIAPLTAGAPWRPRVLELRSEVVAERPAVHLVGLALDELLGAPADAPPPRASALLGYLEALVRTGNAPHAGGVQPLAVA